MNASVAIISDRPRSPLERVDSILDAFDQDHTSLTLLGLVARTGLPKTTVHRTVHKMVTLGWVEYRRGRYTIGARLFERATLAADQLMLRAAALPFLQELCAATRETVNLAVLDGCEVIYLEKLVGRRPITTMSRIGGHMPALCTALGKSLAAFSPVAVAEQIIDNGSDARTPNTITTPREMRQELARVRGEGISYDREESGIGVRCIAAPVLGANSSCVAAISITAPAGRLLFAQHAPAVRHAAQQASQAMAGRAHPATGWRRQPDPA
jgi:DNA-binding IclR family transcriptional regulator